VGLRRIENLYGGRSEVLFLTVYQREPHARQMAFKEIGQPRTYEERWAIASRTREELTLKSPILVDEMDDRSRALFGDLPSPAIVIGPDGVIRCKLPWAEPDVLEGRLEELLAADVAPATDRVPAGDAETTAAELRATLGRALSSLWAAPAGKVEAARARLSDLLPVLERQAPALQWQALLGLASRPAGTTVPATPPAEGGLRTRAAELAESVNGGSPLARSAALAHIVAAAEGTPLAALLLEQLAADTDPRVGRWARAGLSGSPVR
jgi:hypothetical protein